MRAKNTILTREEQDIILLAAKSGPHLSNTQIAQRLGMSVSRVKMLMHQACIKLGARNRTEAILFAIRRGEILLTDYFTLEEIVEIIGSVGSNTLRKVAHLVRKNPEHRYFSGRYKQIIPSDRRQNSVLTERERDVLILVGRGLTNKEIADKLYITIKAVNTFIYRACTKLGVHNRAEAVVSALKQREISTEEIYSLNELIQYLATLGADSVEKMAQTLDQKLGQ